MTPIAFPSVSRTHKQFLDVCEPVALYNKCPAYAFVFTCVEKIKTV
jgi:hypothetical protein